jgi:hypothetical protein
MAWFRNHKRITIIHYSHWWFNFSWCDVLCGLVPLPQSSSKLEWFQNVESMLNHHLAGLLGLGSLGWAGHQIHISLPVNKLLDAVDPKKFLYHTNYY